MGISATPRAKIYHPGKLSTVEPPWIGPGSKIPIAGPLPGAGLIVAEVACTAPRYVTLHIRLQDETLAPIAICLEPVGACRYQRVISLVSAVREAWLEIVPERAGAADVVSAALAPARWWDLAGLGLRAAMRHAATPVAFLAKMQQVLAGSANLGFANGSAVSGWSDATYHNWQAAFESGHEVERIITALERAIGSRSVRVLAVIAVWNYGSEALNEVVASLARARRTELHVLGQTLSNDRIAVRSWQRLTDDRAYPLPSHEIRAAAERAGADIVIFLDRPGRFHELAVVCLTLALQSDPSALAVYADHDRIDREGRRHDPVFKPVWSPDYEAAWDYVAQPLAFRADSHVLDRLNDVVTPMCPSFSVLMDLACSGVGQGLIRHVPRVLFHERQISQEQRLMLQPAMQRVVAAASGKPVANIVAMGSDPEPLRRIDHRRPGCEPSVSVIIPSKDNPRMLWRAYRSIVDCSHPRCEIVVVDNGSISQAQQALLADLAATREVKVTSYPQPFNFAGMINFGRGRARGEILILLNDDVDAVDTEWLPELCSQAARPEIGCVGALLLYPGGRVQHAGAILGTNGGVGHALRFGSADADDDGYRLKVVREVSAVTGACLAVRASVFDDVGGFAEDLPVTLNDIDFCLKVRQQGYRNLFTPNARLIHRESSSRGLDVTPQRLTRLSREMAAFVRRWGVGVLSDPYFSPHLSPAHEDFRRRSV